MPRAALHERAPEGPERIVRQLERLLGERDADDRDREKYAGNHVADPKPNASEDEPQDIEDDPHHESISSDDRERDTSSRDLLTPRLCPDLRRSTARFPPRLGLAPHGLQPRPSASDTSLVNLDDSRRAGSTVSWRAPDRPG